MKNKSLLIMLLLITVSHAYSNTVLNDDNVAQEIILAQQGNSDAQNQLGIRYFNGTVQDYAEAMEWFQKAAEQNYADAQYNLGLMYKNGEAGVKDSKLAIKWFLKAAEQNHAAAQFNLGMMYQNGDSVEKNEKVAQEWLQKAEQQKTK